MPLIATEDARFNDHSGIDVKAVARAILKTCGAEAKERRRWFDITQQLAKQSCIHRHRGFMSRAVQKPIEWMIAICEPFYSKEMRKCTSTSSTSSIMPWVSKSAKQYGFQQGAAD